METRQSDAQFWNSSLTVLKEEAIKRVGLLQRKVWCTVDKKIEISSIKEEWKNAISSSWD